MDGYWLRLWHTCVDLLDQLEHEVDGSIYDKVACHCPPCVRSARAWARLEARAEVATTEEDLIRAGEDYHREMDEMDEED